MAGCEETAEESDSGRPVGQSAPAPSCHTVRLTVLPHTTVNTVNTSPQEVPCQQCGDQLTSTALARPSPSLPSDERTSQQGVGRPPWLLPPLQLQTLQLRNK